MTYKKELEESIIALKNARKTLSLALNKLNSASNWGIWDMLGGGLFSSFLKFNRMDEAEKLINDLNYDLEVLKKELKDINIDLAKFSSVSNINRTFDMFFDNIFSDLNTQSKIKENIKSLEEMDSNLSELEIKLEEELKSL